ncbi:histidinol-phosphate aminotransferase family protein [Methanomicrobium antiquum]|uniref:Aminotransferase n=1 Tax=Methanomicrobium antiquum TaxID=487686 RepID=A0AAF0FSQ3_9EURY|nr:histidinol-phosphate transaminase [Methanomicrobium antiquum]WFN37814.1 histidinol-phosphate aminotransferase family protein [Methanomicrobium antiquum]
MESGFPRKVSHGGASQLRLDKDKNSIMDFSANLNPFPPVFDWKPNPALISAYPDDSYHELKTKVARRFGCHEDEICVGNGSIEVIRSFFYATVKKGDYVKTDLHTFGEYALSIKLAGGIHTTTEDKAIRIRVVCNPNNPTGYVYPKDELLKMADACNEKDSFLFVDEAFNDLSDKAETLIGEGISNVFVSRSLTKSFSVPGLRIGFGFGSPEIIEKIEVIRPPWTLNGFAEDFASKAIEIYDELEKSRNLINIEREWLYKKLDEIGIEYLPSGANFILLNINRDSKDFIKEMLKEGIFIRDCASFGLLQSVRVAVRTRRENICLVEALQKCWR